MSLRSIIRMFPPFPLMFSGGLALLFTTMNVAAIMRKEELQFNLSQVVLGSLIFLGRSMICASELTLNGELIYIVLACAVGLFVGIVNAYKIQKAQNARVSNGILTVQPSKTQAFIFCMFFLIQLAGYMDPTGSFFNAILSLYAWVACIGYFGFVTIFFTRYLVSSS